MTYATKHNGGRMLINVGTSGDVDVAGEYPWLNWLKSAVGWSRGDSANSPIDVSKLDANGYPNAIVHGGWTLQSIYCPLASQLTGTWSDLTQVGVLNWTGDGTCAVGALSVAAVAYTITAAQSTGTTTRLTCAAGVGNNTFNVKVGQLLAVSGITGTGWTGVGTRKILSIPDLANRIIEIDFDSSALGAAGLAGTPKVTNSLSTTGANGITGSGRYVFSHQAGGDINKITFSISAVASTSNYPHDIKMCHEDDEAALLAGDVFGTKFKQKLIEANFGVIRFENWQHTDATSSMTTWATRRPVGHVHYAGGEQRANLWCGSTTGTVNGSGTATYTASAPSIDSSTGAAWNDTLHHGTTVQISFDKSASATITSVASSDGGTTTTLTMTTGATDTTYVTGESIVIFGSVGWTGLDGTRTVLDASVPGTVKIALAYAGGSYTASSAKAYHNLATLAVGATAAKNILNGYSNPLSVLPGTYPVGATTSSFGTLVYDALMDAWIKQGGDNSALAVYLGNGVPPEICFQLCAELGAHPHWNAPLLTHTVGGVTDYYTGLATFNLNNAPSWMVPHYEGQNEVFNHKGGFYETFYAENTSKIFNGAKVISGVLTVTTYTVSAVSVGATTSDITLSTANNVFQVGAYVTLALSTSGSMNGYVTAINVGGNQDKITVDVIPSSGTFTTVVPTTDYHGWYGIHLSYVGQVLAAVYGSANLGTKYHVLCGVQTGTAMSLSSGTNTTTQSDQRLESHGFILRNSPISPYSASAAKNWASAMCCATYFANANVSVSFEAGLSTAFDAKKFICSCVNGVVTVTSCSIAGNGGVGPLQNDIFFGIAIPISQGVKIASAVTGTFPNLTFTLSDTTISFTTNTYYAGTDPLQLQYAVDGCMGAFGTFTISGSTLTVVALDTHSQPITTQMLLVYPGSPDNLSIIAGSGSTWTLSASPGNVAVATRMYACGAAHLPALKNIYKNWYAWAQSKLNTNGTPLLMMSYEGGNSPDYDLTAKDAFRYAQKFVTSTPNNSLGLLGYFTINVNNYFQQGGLFCAEYQLAGRYPSGGVWQMLETIHQTPNPPQFEACRLIGAGKAKSILVT